MKKIPVRFVYSNESGTVTSRLRTGLEHIPATGDGVNIFGVVSKVKYVNWYFDTDRDTVTVSSVEIGIG